VRVFAVPPQGYEVATLIFDLAYDPAQVVLPGAGTDASVKARLGGTPPGAISAINDRDDVARIAVAQTRPLPAGAAVAVVEFDLCRGVAEPKSFSCRVDSCAALQAPLEGCTCRVEIESAG
jgi:hypothetical protein